MYKNYSKYSKIRKMFYWNKYWTFSFLIGKKSPLSHLRSRKKPFFKKNGSLTFSQNESPSCSSVSSSPLSFGLSSNAAAKVLKKDCLVSIIRKILQMITSLMSFIVQIWNLFLNSSWFQIYFTILKLQITEARSKTTRGNVKSKTSDGKSVAHHMFWQLLNTFENFSCWNLKLLLVKHLGFFSN